MRRLLLFPLLAVASPALADTLPLARGAYVKRNNQCAGAPDALLRDYNGQGIGSPKTDRCTGRVLANIRRRYTLRQSCVHYAAHGRPYRTSENVKVRVDSPRSFTDLKTGAHYRLCPGLKL